MSLPGQSARRTSSRLPSPTSRDCADPAPLSPRQLKALLGGVLRQLLWGLPAGTAELRKWRRRATQIPDRALRQGALRALQHKRGNTLGAGMFWTLPRARSPSLLRLLVTYQILWDYLDSIGEHDATTGLTDARRLHFALIEALDPDRPISDYRFHYGDGPGDGGYLSALIHACRKHALRLPSFHRVRPLLLAQAARVEVQSINHDPHARSREANLRAWAAREFPAEHRLQWFELAAAAGANISIYALLALAAEQACSESEISRTYAAYFPWAGALATMLDSFVDQRQDSANGEQSYVAYYASPQLATEQIARLIERCLYEVGALSDPQRHTLLLVCMVAMYLSKNSARTPELLDGTRRLIGAGGSLTKILLPILRAWRISFKQRSA